MHRGFRVVVYVLLLLVQCSRTHDHGVLCTAQFNYWYRFAAGAADAVHSLAISAGYGHLSSCEMQSNANDLYTFFLEAGVGFNKYCNATGGGVPAGGCAFSYPVTAFSTCRLKVFGASESPELQWCMPDLPGTLTVASGTVGLGGLVPETGPNPSPVCTNWTAFNTFDQASTEHEQTCKSQHQCYCTDPSSSTSNFQSSAVLFYTFANTLVDLPGCSTSGSGSASGSGGGSGAEIAAIVLGVLLLLAVAIIAVLVCKHQGGQRADPAAGESGIPYLAYENLSPSSAGL